jgi:hypothetical protein
MPKLHEGKSSLFVALVHETLKAKCCQSRADLIESVKRRAARLHLRYDAAIIGAAVEQVAHARGLPFESAPAASSPPITDTDERDPSHTDACAILARVKAHIRTMPKVRQLSAPEIVRHAFERDRRRALGLVLDEITAAEARCDALESTKDEP